MNEPDLWAGIEAGGPQPEREFFDPLLVDDVLQAERSSTQFDRRRSFVANYAWAVPTRDSVARIADFVGERSVLEVCAGQGLWAKLLSLAGVSIIATDGQPGEQTHFPVEALEAREAVLRHDECEALMLCWPPFKDVCAFHALDAFGGDRVVYVGDVRFTAEGSFHALLASGWQLDEQIGLPSWPGTSDFVFLHTRR